MTGTIKTLQATFGFIKDEVGLDRFFHGGSTAEGLKLNDLKVGDKVVFEPELHPKGERAANVRLA